MSKRVDSMCIFEHSEFPHCCQKHRDKRKWCYIGAPMRGLQRFYGDPPRWCPLRKGKIVVRLTEKGIEIEYDKILWQPSTDIADAIEALERLPQNMQWHCGTTNGGKHFCIIFVGEKSVMLSTGNERLTTAICRALLDKRVLAAIKAARKEEAK